MLLNSHSTKGNVNGNLTAAVALTLLLTSGVGQSAFAQDMSSTGSFSASSTMGSEQESLLPPEVVPLDPSAASSLQATQAQNRQTEMTGDQASVPGLVNNIPEASGMQHAKDFRKAAYESLYGQGQLPQQGAQQPQGESPMWATGVGFNQAPGLVPGAQGAPQAPPTPVVNSWQGQQQMAQGPAQSQTLTGGAKQQPKIRDIRRAGFSNGLSAVASFGAGALMSSYLMRPQNALFGAGMYGLTMTGFGTRNAFRF